MANIKITELNGITKKASDDVLAIVDISANETKKIAVEDLLDKNVELIAVTDTEPAECSYGDKYYNTEDNLIYTAIANNTWGEDGEEPIEGIFYVVFGEQSSYAYNGTTLISVGGGTEDIIISDTQPTGDDWKLWIDTGEIGSQVSEITNSYSTSTGLGYSADYVNNLHTYSTDEVRIGTWIDGKPLYRRTFYITDNLSTPLNYVHNINNIGYCDCHVVMITNDISVAGFYASSTDFFRFFRDGGFIKIRYGSDNHPTAFAATLEYTKTTD